MPLDFWHNALVSKASTNKQFELPNGQQIEIAWLRSRRNKHIRLTVGAHGVRVSSPPRARWSNIVRFLQQQAGWLATHLDQHQQKLPPDQLLFQGTTYQLQLAKTGNRVELKNNTCYLNPVSRTNKSAVQTLNRWLRSQAAEKLTSIFLQYRQQMNIQAPQLKWRETTSRWGSCSSNGNIMLNWRLIHTPSEVAQYVIIHELAHRVHHNHSKKFWQLVEQFDPAYKVHRGWLKRNGHRCQTPEVTIFPS